MKIPTKKQLDAKQLAELSASQKTKLQNLWFPELCDMVITLKGIEKANRNQHKIISDGQMLAFVEINKSCYLPVLSIGNMVELLNDANVVFSVEQTAEQGAYKLIASGTVFNKSNMCDVLWEAVKKYVL